MTGRIISQGMGFWLLSWHSGFWGTPLMAAEVSITLGVAGFFITLRVEQLGMK